MHESALGLPTEDLDLAAAKIKVPSPALRVSTAESGLDPEIVSQIALGEHAMRRDLAGGILRVFVVGNLAVWSLVALLAAVDIVMMVSGHQAPQDRVIDRSVVKTLIGATTVQIGVIMVMIAANLFPQSTAQARPWWKLWG